MGGPNRKPPAVPPEPAEMPQAGADVIAPRGTAATPARLVSCTPQGRTLSMLSRSVLLQRIADGNSAGQPSATPVRPASMGNVRRSLEMLAPVVETGVESHIQPPSTPHNTSAPQISSSLKKRAQWVADKVRDSGKGLKKLPKLPESPKRMHTHASQPERQTVVPVPPPTDPQQQFYDMLLNKMDGIQNTVSAIDARVSVHDTQMGDLEAALMQQATVTRTRFASLGTDKQPGLMPVVDNTATAQTADPTVQNVGIQPYDIRNVRTGGLEHPGIPLVDTETAIPIDRRASMFYGAPPKVLEYGTSRLPKCFTDGSNITVKYNHTTKESIEDFIRNIKIQLRPYPIYQWIALTRKQLGKSIELAIQEFEITLLQGRHNVIQTDGTLAPCPDGFYSWPEFEDWLLTKYHRPLREIRVI